MVFVEEMILRVRGLHQLSQLLAKKFYLLIAQHWNSRQIAVLIEELELCVVQSVYFPLLRRIRHREKIGNRPMVLREIVGGKFHFRNESVTQSTPVNQQGLRASDADRELRPQGSIQCQRCGWARL